MAAEFLSGCPSPLPPPQERGCWWFDQCLKNTHCFLLPNCILALARWRLFCHYPVKRNKQTKQLHSATQTQSSAAPARRAVPISVKLCTHRQTHDCDHRTSASAASPAGRADLLLLRQVTSTGCSVARRLSGSDSAFPQGAGPPHLAQQVIAHLLATAPLCCRGEHLLLVQGGDRWQLGSLLNQQPGSADRVVACQPLAFVHMLAARVMQDELGPRPVGSKIQKKKQTRKSHR